MPESLPFPAPTSGPPPTLLPASGADAAVADLLAQGVAPADAAAEHPTSPLAWAELAEIAEADGAETGTPAVVAAYAYARTGYHRGLDALRRAGWRGAGPVPWSHEPNRGFLRALAALGRAAAAIGEDDEAARIGDFVLECDAGAADLIRGAGAARTGPDHGAVGPDGTVRLDGSTGPR